MLNGSIAWSEASANIGWGYFTFAGGQNWWDPNSDINRIGRADDDRPLIIKLMSSIELPFKFVFSGYFRFLTGPHFHRSLNVEFPDSLNGYKPRSTTVTVRAETTNSRSFQAQNSTDLRLEKTFKFGIFKFGVWVDAFNVFGNWNFIWNVQRIAGGYVYKTGAVARYASFGVPDAVSGTRKFVFGTRVNF